LHHRCFSQISALAFSRQTINNIVDANFLKYAQMAVIRVFAFAVAFSLLAGCSTMQSPSMRPPAADASPQAVDVVMTALSLYDTGYRFGGKNPEAGVDCSGFVSYVFSKAVGYRVTGDAATIAHQGREVRMEDLRPGDLVFFNTLGRPFSHVGIFIGNGEFIHAPSSKGAVRIDRLSNPYYASRFQAAKAILQD
jgi:cell wall-associated NlpC family hydrolase